MAALKVITQTSPDIGLGLDDIVICLPEDARLSRGVDELVLSAFGEHPDAVALYGDLTVNGQRQARPAWSPTRVQSEPGGCLPLAVRTSWPLFDPSASPLELERRLAESDVVVLHLPAVLSHHASVAVANEVAADDRLFEPGPRPGTRRRRPWNQGQASTSIIIPSAGYPQPGSTTPMLTRCLETVRLLDPPPLEIIVVVGDEYQGEPPVSDIWPTAADDGSPARDETVPVKVVHRGRGAFDFARAVNCGLVASRGEFVLLLNDDIEAETTNWLGRMAAHFQDPTVGAVGAALLFSDRTVQHLGVVMDDAHALHCFRHHTLSDTAPHGGDVARDVVSVTGACLLVRRSVLLAVGGMSLEFPISYGDIDLCLRLLRSGFRVVVEPAAVLIHYESASRDPKVKPWEWERFTFRWGEVIDPWYHPGYRRLDHPEQRNRNADHLGPVDPDACWPARNTEIQSRLHESQKHEFLLGIPPRIQP